MCEHLQLPIQRINDYQLLLKVSIDWTFQHSPTPTCYCHSRLHQGSNRCVPSTLIPIPNPPIITSNLILIITVRMDLSSYLPWHTQSEWKWPSDRTVGDRRRIDVDIQWTHMDCKRRVKSTTFQEQIQMHWGINKHNIPFARAFCVRMSFVCVNSDCHRHSVWIGHCEHMHTTLNNYVVIAPPNTKTVRYFCEQCLNLWIFRMVGIRLCSAYIESLETE